MGDSEDMMSWLQRWYSGQCNGDWEQNHGITIQTLDNPGWLVKIDLDGIPPAEMAADRDLVVVGEPPGPQNGNIGGDVWMTCGVKSGQFVGAGDPAQLGAILVHFRKLVEEASA